jgi:hypothetical protein
VLYQRNRPLGVWIGEHINNLKQGLMDKSRLAKHAYEEGYHTWWQKAKVGLYLYNRKQQHVKKYNEAVHMAHIINQSVNPAWKSPLFGSHVFVSRSAGCRAIQCKHGSDG